MIVQTDIDSIKRYRDRLGEELYEHLAELWFESEKNPDLQTEKSIGKSDVTESAPVDFAAEKGDCPLCGYGAEMGILLDSGKETEGSARKLWCAYCEHVWNYERIRCTRCGTRNQDALSYHFDEDDSARRIYYCSECQGTQKVLNEKDLENPAEVDLRLEGILMEGLEQAVQEHCADKRGAD
ncbi:MAG: formate dehydrogenase accessory protein FdhE [Coriobacteriia bacterium]|nr:formate dehydrogenase accessory protein FdhE [Coriobacteriia bacterium]